MSRADRQILHTWSGDFAPTIFLALVLGVMHLAQAQTDDLLFRHGFEGGREAPASQTIGPRGGELISSDGLLMLTVPDGALDQDTTITITELTGDAIPLALSDPSVRKVYDLQPDGLVFGTPASLAASTTGSPDTGVPLIGLFNNSGDTLELLATADNTVENTADAAGILATAQIEHFSTVEVAGSSRFEVSAAPGELDGVIFRCDVDPNPVLVGEEFTVTLEIETDADSDARSAGQAELPTFSDVVSLQNNFDPPGFSLNPDTEQTITRTATGTCNRAGQAALSLFLKGDNPFSLFTLAASLNIPPTVVPPSWSTTLIKTIECVDPVVELETGVFPFPLMKHLETIQVLAGLVQAAAFANFSPGTVPALVRGDKGFAVFDLLTGEILLDGTGGGSSEDVTPLGAVGVTRPDPGPKTPAALLSYAQDRSFNPFGLFLLGYDTEDMRFSDFGQSVPGSFSDASPVGGDPVADEVVVVDNQGISFIQFDFGSSSYAVAAEELRLDDSRYGNRQVATAYSEFTGGPVLAVTTAGSLWFDDRGGEMATEIGDLGEAIRRLRCEMPVCAATDFIGGAINIITWDGMNMPSIVGDPVPVGDGPVGLDVFALSNGNHLVGTTGFNDNTITFTEVDTVGMLVRQDTYALPTGVDGPGHVVFLADPEAPDDPYAIGTGFSSNTYFVTKQSELGPSVP